jgi:hypothetical protein
MKTRAETVTAWIETFSPVETMRGNPQALARELDAICAVFDRDDCAPSLIDAAFQHIKMTSQSRAWPTVAMVYDALREVRRQASGEHVAGSQGGDRMALDSFELAKLDNSVLPTMRRWMRLYPGLRGHAISTLKYWGEPLKDDMGAAYDSMDAKK